MPHTNWDKDAYIRLLAATLASHPEFRPNFSRIAEKMGEGSTYDSIQSRFRSPQKMAREMNVGTPSESKSGSMSAQSTPRKPRKSRSDGVASGRVSKKSSPKKGASATNLRSLEQDLLSSFYENSNESSGSTSEYGFGDPTGPSNALGSFDSLANVDFQSIGLGDSEFAYQGLSHYED